MINFHTLCPRQNASPFQQVGSARPEQRFPILLTLLFFLAVQVLSAQTWTGATSTDWNTASNWLAGVVPVATDNVTIPDVTNDPVIMGGMTAVAKSVTVHTSGLLTVNATGSLTINGSTAQGIRNQGTVENNGTIVIGSTSGVGQYGIYNQGTFNNNAGGEIRINRSTLVGLFNSFGTFTNAAKITIGAVASVGQYGLYSQTTFSNNAGGEIIISRSTIIGLFNTSATFGNAAKITIGAVGTSIGESGILNVGLFNNNAGGDIKIDRATVRGLGNGNTFTNAAKITIGAVASVGQYGIENYSTFDNNAGSEISLNRSTITGLNNVSGTFTNGAKITIGAVASVGQYGIENYSVFNNNTGGEIGIDRSSYIGLYNVSGTFTNAAEITVGAVASVGTYGIFNVTTFNNSASGGSAEIKIDQSSDTGISNSSSGTFNNAAKITIGAVASVGRFGIESQGTFSNNAGGEINLDRSTILGLYNVSGTFTNAAKITVGAVASTGQYGVYTQSTFDNNAGGEICIDRSTVVGLFNFYGTFTNAAKITIGAVASVGTKGIENAGIFTNNPCAALIRVVSNSIVSNTGTFDNAGCIIENASGNSSISINTGVVQNLNGGTFTIGSGNAPVTNTGVIWTGCTDTDWATASNWLGAAVPVAADDVVITDVSNDPVIMGGTAAVAKSVRVHASGLLTLNATGSLTINGAGSQSLINQGTVENNGTITIGSTANVGLYGIYSAGTFNNNAGGEINIDRSSGGGLYHISGTFTNAAKITIGASAGVGLFGIYNQSTFINNIGGDISIDRSTDYSLFNVTGSTFTNAAKITIGAVVSTGQYGILNWSTFNNNAGGEISIDRTTDRGLFNQLGTFTNASKITIGAGAGITGVGIGNQATLHNTSCATLTMVAPLNNSSTFTNSGLFIVNTAAAHTNSALTNNGIIEYPQDNPIPNVTNNDLIVAPVTGECLISNALQIGGANSFTAGSTWYEDADLTTAAGTYDQGSNEFTFTNLPNEGAYTLYCSISDDVNGCPRTVSIKVTYDDVTKPTITCPADQTVAADGSCYGTVGTRILVSKNDNCTTSGSITESQSPASGVVLSGHNDAETVTLSATDGNGNTETCQFTVTLKDVTPPVIICPTYISKAADQGVCTSAVTYSVTATDNCTASGSIALVRTNGLAGGSTFPGGTSTVNWKATDAVGNTTTCAFIITITDGQMPSITCPANIAKNTDPGLCSAVVTYANPTFSDNCSGTSIQRTSGQASGTAFQKGVHSVNWQATDAAGLVAVCNFTITVSDMQIPTIACPSNMVRSTNAGLCTAVVNYTIPTASDNCGSVTVARTSGLAPNSVFPKGTNSVTWEATDGASPANKSSCTFTITVNDNQLPTITCPANMTRSTDAGLCTAVANYATPTVTDNCTDVSVTIVSGLASGSAFPKGQTTVRWKATDGVNLTKTCTFRVTVNDTQVPSITCPASQSVGTDVGLCSAVVTYANATFTDNCSGGTVVRTSGLASGSAFPKGTNTVVWRATDGVGLTKSCTFMVTVTDAQLPTVTCPANIVVTAAPGQCSATVTYSNPAATDNCTVQSIFLLSGLPSGASFPQGVTTNTWRATDNSGGSNTCAFTVTVSCGTAQGMMNDRMINGELSDKDSGLTLRLAPNPATTEVWVWVESTSPETLAGMGYELTVFDAQGRAVWQQSLAAGGSLAHHLTVSLLDFPAGLYFLTLRLDGAVLTKRLVVSRL